MTRKAYSLFTTAAVSSLLLVGCDTAPDGGGDATAPAADMAGPALSNGT